MKTIVLPTDFSENARKAMEYGLNLYRNDHCRFILTHAIHSSEDSAEMLVQIDDVLENQAQDSMDKEMTRIQDELVNSDSTIETIVKHGKPEKILAGISEEVNADLIIMGSKGINSDGDKSIGSNAVSTIQNAPCPVIVIPEIATVNLPKNVVFATDYDLRNMGDTLYPLKDLVERNELSLSMVTVFANGELKSKSYELKEKLFRRFFDGLDCSFHYFRDQNIIEGIYNYIHINNADLLVMAPHKKGLIHMLFNKSNTNMMALLTDIPLMALRDQ